MAIEIILCIVIYIRDIQQSSSPCRRSAELGAGIEVCLRVCLRVCYRSFISIHKQHKHTLFTCSRPLVCNKELFTGNRTLVWDKELFTGNRTIVSDKSSPTPTRDAVMFGCKCHVTSSLIYAIKSSRTGREQVAWARHLDLSFLIKWKWKSAPREENRS